MTESPKVSIILPAYNESAYIRDTLESLRDQTYDKIQLLVVDDASDDDTAEVAERTLSDVEDSIVLRNRTNMGQVFSRNRGAMHADGEYIIFHDADDFSLPTRIEKQVRFLESNPDVGVVGSAFYYVNPKRNERRIKIRPTDDETIREGLSRECMVNLGTAMFRVEALHETRLFQARRAEGYKLMIDIAQNHELSNLNEPLYVYKINEGSSSQQDELEAKVAIFKRNIEAIREIEGGYTDAFLSVGWFLYMFLPPGIKRVVRDVFSPTQIETLSSRQEDELEELLSA